MEKGYSVRIFKVVNGYVVRPDSDMHSQERICVFNKLDALQDFLSVHFSEEPEEKDRGVSECYAQVTRGFCD